MEARIYWLMKVQLSLVSEPDPATKYVSENPRLFWAPTYTFMVRNMGSEVVVGGGEVTVTVEPLTTAVNGTIAS